MSGVLARLRARPIECWPRCARSVWVHSAASLSTSRGTDSRTPAHDDRRLAPLSQADSYSLIPVAAPTGILPRLADFVAGTLHRLVVLATTLKTFTANEKYVRKVLVSRVGIDPVDLDVLALNHPEVFQLSVRHSIEPVTSFLRSQGITGSALASLVAWAPGVLSKDVENHLLPLCFFLREQLGNRGIGLLLRDPPLAESQVEKLRQATNLLHDVLGASRDDIADFLWRYPGAFRRLAETLRRDKYVNSIEGQEAMLVQLHEAVGGNEELAPDELKNIFKSLDRRTSVPP